MAADDDDQWIEYLPVAQCWQLMSLHPVGRLGVVVDGGPEVYPVNHVVENETIVFRTDDGSKLQGLSDHPNVCFETDGLNLDDSTGWSVLVKGRAFEIVDEEQRVRAERLPLRFWGIGKKSHWIRIVPTEVTGREICRPERGRVPFALTPDGPVG